MNQAEQPDEVIRGAWMRVDTLLRQDPAGAGMEAAANMVADLRHWCDAKGIDFDQVIGQADANYHADHGREAPPTAPAARVLTALGKARPILTREGVPAASLNAFERALMEAINDQFMAARAPRRPSEQVFEDSVAEVARDQWQRAINRDLQKGLRPEQVYQAALDRLSAASLFGPTRRGAIEAVEGFCKEYGMSAAELASFKDVIAPRSLGDKLRQAVGSRMSVR